MDQRKRNNLYFSIKDGNMIEAKSIETNPYTNQKVQTFVGWTQYYEENSSLTDWTWYPWVDWMSPEKFKAEYLPVNSETKVLFKIEGLDRYEELHGPILRCGSREPKDSNEKKLD